MARLALPLLLVATAFATSARAEGEERSAAPALLPELAAGVEVDEAYRAQFALCDSQNQFRGQSFEHGRGCRGDPNRAEALLRLPGGAIAYVSKLAVDLDGSPFACGPDHQRSDQCPTALMLDDAQGAETPLDADRVPYVVIPAAGPGPWRGEFSRLTGVRVGDLGVVIKDGVVVPVIVGDTGPYNKLGEGSLALHRALGRELCVDRDSGGVCRHVVDDMTSIDDGVTTVLFPGSRPRGLTPDTVEAVVRAEGLRLWDDYQRRRQAGDPGA
ncbi:MAG TPA: glycoside hydrolase family 75 protein [Caulobacteraceae bacterium]